MKKTGAQKIKLGIFIILGTLILITALYLIGNRQNLFTKNIKVFAQFGNVNGLQLGNNVRYSGINVGTVSGIKMQSDTLILVEMLLQESRTTYIRTDAVATISSDGLVGNMIVNILPTTSQERPIITGDTITTYSRIGTDDMLTTLNVTNENAAILTAKLLKITTEIIDGKGTLGMLISDATVADNLKQTVVQLNRASTEVVKTITALNEKMAMLDMEQSVAAVLLTDSIQGQKMKRIIDNLEKTSEDINTVAKNLEEVVQNVSDGEGALKYLTTDKGLVEDIDSTMQNIKESTARFNENMEALKHNFLFRGYFKKQERQEKKEARKAEKTD